MVSLTLGGLKSRSRLNQFRFAEVAPYVKYSIGGAGGGSRYIIDRVAVTAEFDKVYDSFIKILQQQMTKNRVSANVSHRFKSGDVLRYNKFNTRRSLFNTLIKSLRKKVEFKDNPYRKNIISTARLTIFSDPAKAGKSTFYQEFIDEAMGKTLSINLPANKNFPIFSREAGKVVWYNSGPGGKTITIKNKPINTTEAFNQALAMAKLMSL